MTTAMAVTMPAAVYRRPGELDVTDVAVPELGSHDVLVEVAYCGVCGTDLHMVLDGWGAPDTIFGHEWSGRVAAAGAEARINEGAAVVGRGWAECGRCEQCQAGRPGLCSHRPLAGLDDGHSGAFARYLVTDHRNLTAVPDGVGLREAAYAEPLAVAMHAVTQGAFQPGGRAMVFGCGPIGAAVPVRAHRPRRSSDRGRAVRAAPGPGPAVGCRGPARPTNSRRRTIPARSRPTPWAGCSRPRARARRPKPASPSWPGAERW